METTHATITKIEEVARPNAKGALVPHMQISFEVGDDGPFTEVIPVPEFSEEKARARIEERAAQIRKLRSGE